MLSITISKRITGGRRRDLLSAIQPNDRPPADIVVHTPRRFLSLRKLIRPNEAIDALLEIIGATQSITKSKGARFALTTTLPRKAPRLLLSHHTFDTPQIRHLRNLGTNVLHFKAADLPGRTSFDAMGFSGWSSMARQTVDTLPLDNIPQTQADAGYDAAKQQAMTQNLSKYAQSDATEAPQGHYVFVALQTIGDMVQKQAFVPMLELLDMVIARFAGTGTQVVIKRHPKCKSSAVSDALRDAVALPHVTLSTASIHTLLARAQALFTVNSGVGSEAIVHGTPIYCFGASDYAAVAHQMRNAATLAALTDPPHHRCDPATLRRFHYYYRNVYQVERATGLSDRLTQLIDAALKP